MAFGVACNVIAEHSKRAPAFLRLCARQAKMILDETKKLHDGEPEPCTKHPEYRAVRRPKNGCKACRMYYYQVQYK